ncbi:DUF748 domain-containing protein [Ferrimonas senticii]|uniref:DUF748 domain-containing protein n=1 Tax=Ferrimonas senticii TaxID=394566 RepID=UPI000421C194|nr:DUF748 domain-containing protein [Ferrimonas senticii]
MVKQWWDKRWVRVGSYSAIAFGVYCGLLGYALPELAKSQVPKWIANNTDGELSVADIQFHPLEWRLQIDQLQLTDKQQQPALTLEQAVLDLDPWRSLANWQGQVRELTLIAPDLQLRNHQGTLNLVEIFAPLTANAEPASSEVPTEPQPIPLAVDKLTLSNGRVGYQQDQRTPLQFTPLNIEASNLNLAQADNRTRLTLTGAGDGKLSVDVASQLTPLKLDVALKLTNAELKPYWQFAQLPLRFDLDDGRLSVSANLAIAEQGEQLAVNLNDGQIGLDDLILSHQQQPLLAVDNLSLKQIQLDLLKQQVNLAEIAIDGGHLYASLSQDGLDLATIFSPITTDSSNSAPQTSATAASKQAPTTTDEAPWQLQVGAAKLGNWQLNFSDQTVASAANWQLQIENFSTGQLSQDLTQPITLALNSRINQTARFDFNGTLLPQPLSLQSTLKLQDFALLDTLPYWQQQLALKLLSGSADVEGEFNLASTEPLDLSFSGRAAINDFSSQDPVGQRDLLKWQALNFDGIQFATSPMALEIATIGADKPYARVIIDEDGSTNLSQIVPAAPKSAEPSNQPAEAPDGGESQPAMAIRIGEVLISNGDAFFADNTLIPKFATGIEQLNGRIGSLSSSENSVAEVDIAGQVDRYAPVALKGSLQPFGAERQLDLGLTFDNFELTSVNPYAGTYAGYYVDQGQLDLALNYKLDGNALKGSNKVVLNQLVLGERSNSKEASNLPLPLAVALMKDGDGVIDLELDVAGNVDDPEFAIGPLILKALGNLITKAVTAPFALLGSLIEGDAPAEFVAFDAGQAQVTTGAKDELKRLSDALKQRPELSLTVLGSVSTSSDSLALAKQSVSAKLGLDIDRLDGDQQWQQLEQLAQTTLGEIDFAELKAQQDPNADIQLWRSRLKQLLLEQQNIGDKQLADLAMARAAATKQVLVDDFALPADKVFIKESRVDLDTRGSRAHLELGAGD